MYASVRGSRHICALPAPGDVPQRAGLSGACSPADACADAGGRGPARSQHRGQLRASPAWHPGPAAWVPRVPPPRELPALPRAPGEQGSSLQQGEPSVLGNFTSSFLGSCRQAVMEMEEAEAGSGTVVPPGLSLNRPLPGRKPRSLARRGLLGARPFGTERELPPEGFVPDAGVLPRLQLEGRREGQGCFAPTRAAPN